MEEMAFVVEDQTFNVKIYVCLDKDKKITANHNKENLLKSNEGLKPENIRELNIVFRKSNYKDDVDLLSLVLKTTDTGTEIDTTRMRYLRFTQLLKSWDLPGKDGKPLPANIESINILEPKIGNAIMDGLEEALKVE